MHSSNSVKRPYYKRYHHHHHYYHHHHYHHRHRRHNTIKDINRHQSANRSR
ncbi:hypothetical protein V1478_001365 [Vespula squamosa]|uniref:Uncharacterized protein n=1 Tax=Vespula squamosa TaxID=30214 RepID=A0ABD2C1C1_VESSQ